MVSLFTKETLNLAKSLVMFRRGLDLYQNKVKSPNKKIRKARNGDVWTKTTSGNQTGDQKQFPKEVIPQLLFGTSPMSLAEAFNFGHS